MNYHCPYCEKDFGVTELQMPAGPSAGVYCPRCNERVLLHYPYLCLGRCGRTLSANKLREKQLHPLLAKLGIERGGFHSLRHGAASSLLADGATPAVVQRQLRHSDARITLEVYGHVIGDEQRSVVQNRSARLVN